MLDLDQRTRAAKLLAEFRQGLIRDLGGDISAQEEALVELCCRQRLILDGIDAWLLEQPSLVNKSKRRLFDVVQQRQTIANALAQYLNMLGLKRRKPPAMDLSDYVQEAYGSA